MKIFFIAFILFVASFANNQKWATQPKTENFGEFKFFTHTPDQKTGVINFTKQQKEGFALTKPFDGDKTVICYGSTAPEKGKAHAVGCVLKSMGAKNCNEVNVDKCMADTSLKPM